MVGYHRSMNALSDKHIDWVEPPLELHLIARQMQVTVARYGVAPGILNAYTDGRGTVVVGKPLIDRLTADELLVVLAHELGHAVWPRTQRYFWACIYTAYAYCTVAQQTKRWHPILVWYFWKQIAQVIYGLLTPVRWSKECAADAVAADVLGKERVQLALAKLADMTGSSGESRTHPPFWFRVACLA